MKASIDILNFISRKCQTSKFSNVFNYPVFNFEIKYSFWKFWFNFEVLIPAPKDWFWVQRYNSFQTRFGKDFAIYLQSAKQQFLDFLRQACSKHSPKH